MKLTIDREADALYLNLDESPAAKSEEISPGVIHERDETAYLLRSPANRSRLLEAVADVAQNRNLVIPDQEQFQ